MLLLNDSGIRGCRYRPLYDQGLVDEELFSDFVRDVENFMELYPATKNVLVMNWKIFTSTQHWEIYSPIAKVAANEFPGAN